MAAALSGEPEGETASADDALSIVDGLLATAIETLDSSGLAPELAARIQETRDCVAAYRKSTNLN